MPTRIFALTWAPLALLFALAPCRGATKLLEFDALVAGIGVTPTSQGWTLSGTPMTNNGVSLVQNNTTIPGQQFGEYYSPLLPAGTFTRGGADYGIEFVVKPLTDIPFSASAWPNMYVTWSDDQFNYNVHVDLFGQGQTSGVASGEIAYGRGSFSPAISGIDWGAPHTVFIGHRGNGSTSTFDFYLDGVARGSIPDSSIARSLTGFGVFQNRIGFGDGTTATEDVAGEWQTLRVWDVNSPAQTLPAVVNTRQPRHTTDVDVFVGGVGYPNYRSPSLVTAQDGALIALAEGRTGEEPGFYGDTDLVMKRSLDGGRTWSAMQVIESPRTFGEKLANPVSLVDESNGRVWVLYNRYEGNLGTIDSLPGTTNNTAWARYSDDSGVTWSSAVDITAGTKDFNNWNTIAFGPGSGIQIESGRLVAPSARWVNGWNTYTVFSDDHGATWQRGALTPGGNLAGENNIVELVDGTIRMDSRSNNSSVAPRTNFISADGGATWGPPIAGQEAESVHAAAMRYSRVSEGDDLNRIVWTGPRGPDRTNLVVRASYDEGQSYGRERLLYDGYSGYSDLTLLQDRSMGVLFETNEARSLTFSSFNHEFFEPPSGLLAHEDFRYASANILGTKNGGYGFSGGWARQADLTGGSNAVIEASDLQYTNFPFVIEGNRRAVFFSGGAGSMSRELATPIDFDADQTHYVSILVRHDSDELDVESDAEMLRISLRSGTSEVAAVGIQGNEGLFVDNGGQRTSTAANFIAKDVPYYLVAKLVTRGDSPGAADQLFLSAFASGQTVPLTESSLVWNLVDMSSLNSQAIVDRLVIGGGNAATWVLDELRMGTDFQTVVSNTLLPTGDYNQNGIVDAADYAIWRDSLGQSISPGDGADGNRNGVIDSGDYNLWRSHFGESLTNATFTATSVPEPKSHYLAAAVAFTIPWLLRVSNTQKSFSIPAA